MIDGVLGVEDGVAGLLQPHPGDLVGEEVALGVGVGVPGEGDPHGCGEPTPCWPQGAYWAWLPGGFIIPARVASASAWSADEAAAAAGAPPPAPPSAFTASLAV